MTYKCKVVLADGSTCGYETDKSRGYSGHMSGHAKRGEIERKVKRLKRLKIEPERKKELSPFDVADALLKKVVDAITKYDTLLSVNTELRGAKSRVFELEKELKAEKEEKERILKIHNQQAQRKDFTSVDELMRLARL